MNILKGFKNKLNNKQKIYVFAILFILIILSFGIPSLARYKNRLDIDKNTTWDGTVAASYRKGSGTEIDPYIISNAKELAYFSTMLSTNDYKNTYFKLNNNIIINNGTFSYGEDGILYTLNNTTFYVKEYTNEFYDNVNYEGVKIGTINLINSLNNFEGDFDGNGYTIYGSYISNNNDELGLFTNLKGNVHDLYVTNTLVYGGVITGGISSTTTNATLKNIMFDGFVIGKDTSDSILTKKFISSGIVAVSNNTSLENVINKSYVYGKLYSAGLIGTVNGITNVLQSYNTGNIKSTDIASGLIGEIEGNIENTSIIKSYNSGLIESLNSSALIGNITNNTGSIIINRVLNYSDIDTMINNITNSVVNIDLSYSKTSLNTYDILSNGTIVLSSNILNKDYLINTLGYSEFVDADNLKDNNGNVWIYENAPILFIDDISNPIANLYVGTHSWNNLGFVLEEILFDSNVSFDINEISDVRPITESFFHIEKSSVPLTLSQIESLTTWTSFSDTTITKSIEEEGKYIIYAKIIDSNNNISYINSEVIVLDKTGSNVTITGNNSTWNTFNESISTNYIDSHKTFTIDATDELSDIKEISYYLANDLMSTTELNNLSFVNYVDNININEYGTYVIYVKVIDNTNHITYVNTDKIIYGGYSLNSIYVGRSNSALDTINISDKSNLTLNFTYSDTTNYKVGDTHMIVSNVDLPINTKLTLINNNTKEKYIKVLTTPSQNIAFSSFKKIGKLNIDEYFIEPSTGVINEDYSLMIDFSNTALTSNLTNVVVHLELTSGVTNISTLSNTLKPFNIYIGDASLSISTTYSGVIAYDSLSTTSIPLRIALNYNLINDLTIKDTTYEDKSIGFIIKMVDGEGNIVSKEYLKNIKYSVNGIYYSISNDGIARIKLNNGLNSFNDNLVIETMVDNSSLKAGTYYFKIQPFASYDGENTNTYSDEVVSIPVTNNTTKKIYNFDVIYNDSRIISKSGSTAMNFNILQNGLINPNIRVSLYKKKSLTAYNQDYVIVDLKDYVTNSLESVSDNVYYVSKTPYIFNGLSNTYNNLSLNLINLKFESNGYKLIFELYDGNEKISSIGETFIIK